MSGGPKFRIPQVRITSTGNAESKPSTSKFQSSTSMPSATMMSGGPKFRIPQVRITTGNAESKPSASKFRPSTSRPSATMVNQKSISTASKSRHVASNMSTSTSTTAGNTLNSTASSPNSSVRQPPSTAGSKPEKNTRGPGRGLHLDKMVKRNGKMKIVFNPYETIPTQYTSEFADAIGVTVRAHADIEGVSKWSEVTDTNKQACQENLLQWFEIEDLSSVRVQTIIDQTLQTNYRNWRYRLGKIHKDMKNKGLQPRNSIPRRELTVESWLALCQHVESDRFQRRSDINRENRQCMLFPHTSGRTRNLVRYRSMVNRSRILLWKSNHVRRRGEFMNEFVNEEAEMTYGKMTAMEELSMTEGETSKTEEEIMVETLGVRSGYQKGMGWGVKVPRRHNYSVIHETQTQLESAKEEIQTLKLELESQKEENKKTNDLLEKLRAQAELFEQFMLNHQRT